MLSSRLPQSVCKACRSKLLAATALDAGSRTLPTTSSRTGLHKRIRLSPSPAQQQHHRSPTHQHRHFSSTSGRRNEQPNASNSPPASADDDHASDKRTTIQREDNPPPSYTQLEAAARAARQRYGDVLPEALLTREESVVYERLYGAPLRIAPEEVLQAEAEAEAGAVGGAYEEAEEGELVRETLWVEGKGGKLEEVEFYHGGPDGGRVVEEGEVLEDEDAVAERLERLRMEEAEDEEEEGDWMDYGPAADKSRTHPLTSAGRFATSPTTLQLPRKEFIDPVAEILAASNKKHLADVSQRVFGGHRLPHSTRTLRPMGGELVQQPIPLEPAQTQMSPMEGDSYLAAVMPGTYAAVTSILVEVRKRLGSEWIEGLLKKEGGPLILDVSSGGAAVVAWREILKAEWERIQEASGTSNPTPAPVGKASVITGSDTLRHRAAQFLENTTFLPRLPDPILPGEKVGRKARKVYDIIVAPHALWSLKEDYLRKAAVQRLWSLLDPRGGLLVLMEKGLPRGFEVIAGARALLLDNHIASPGATHVEPQPLNHLDASNKARVAKKEEGMIVAPCTNHAGCPMYTIPGISRNRKDFCYFKQRFIRPPYLQKLLGARDKNHEDVQFSYLAVRRGGDLRRGQEGDLEEVEDAALEGPGVDTATAASLEAERGESQVEDDYGEANTLTLSLPRLILPPLKRRGHVILDVCTPAGRLERWTVPRSFGRQAYRDARKSKWGDLWALGAATRVPRNVRLGRKDGDEKARTGMKRSRS
ncbi:mitochondrial small ribosomal subunit Rsm22-domain-containing protein [Macrophomina phaseolina]|uniref:Mitochondrial small ribosomal subunit Rsm22-domain-containing protein n=1 Tax=Macrophomina phaseolina TaxID=35725 RepID=A0ABQ8GIQ4_9PEZI|nr:mitochondrial small ribosomal subunit Rsm22-domain-containing protein [Macrophomina phaseolina]